MSELFGNLAENLIEGNIDAVVNLTKEALDNGMDAEDVLEKGLLAGMDVLGIVGLSALLTTTMPKMAETIDALEEAGLRDKVKIMIGGAPVTEAFGKEIGADQYASNAAIAVDKGKALLSGA